MSIDDKIRDVKLQCYLNRDSAKISPLSSGKIPIKAIEVVFIQVFSVTVVSKQKMKMKTRNTMALSYHSKVTSNQNK